MPQTWEQRKFSDLVVRRSETSSSANIPKVEYENIISDEGKLNNDIPLKHDSRKGIRFYSSDILYGKLRPYLNNWLFSSFDGIAVGDFWVLNSKQQINPTFIYTLIQTSQYRSVANLSSGTKMPRSDWNTVSNTDFIVPIIEEEQKLIGCENKLITELIAANVRQ